ncbi:MULTISPECIES: GGDEF domain-containing protein [unclassified Roseovarius]|uniref:GGDEF domain-containing protein n=1 Tax=unclassified Roseovarius TaxID=2614913 RepID=UPI00273EFB0E|nr:MULTISPECIES: GGDEF domain-containing protein [unclassified Roseovarius]
MFSLVITSVVIFGNLVLLSLMLPMEIVREILVEGCCIAAMLSAPISYFVGLKLLDINVLAEKLEHAVNHDNLTGACTRASFYQRLERIEDQDLVVIVADIDHFKQVNDRYGHKVGDVALRQFTGTLVRNCREDDVVARFGGEEFIILLNGVREDEGVATAQRLCDCVRAKKIYADGHELKITASFGVAAMTSVSQVEEAFQKADLAAYRAKREGRDQVCLYDPEKDGEVVTPQVAA